MSTPVELELLNIGLYAEPGAGKTTLAFSILEDPANCPALYLNCDKGGTVALPAMIAGRVQSHHSVRASEWRQIARNVLEGRRIGPVAPATAAAGPVGMHHPTSGLPYATLIADAISTLADEEIKARGLVESAPPDQATAIKSPMTALFGDLREVAAKGVMVVQICHSGTTTNVKKGPMRACPALFPSLRGPWLRSLDFCWYMEKVASVAGDNTLDWTRPDFFFFFQPIGQKGSPEHVPDIKTRGLGLSRMLGNDVFIAASKGQRFSLAEVIARMRWMDAEVAKRLKSGISIDVAIDNTMAELNAAQQAAQPAPK